MFRRSIASLENRRLYDRKVREIDRERGYNIRFKYVAIAYVAELAIIAASLVGQYLISKNYDHGDMAALMLMMMTPVVYAVIELCRVPLAIAARTQPSGWIKALAVFGVIMAAGVTVKSLTQLGEQMFHPRLQDVVRSNEALKIAAREQSTFGQKAAEAETVVLQRTAELTEIEGRSKDLTTQLGTVAAPQCTKLSGRNKKGASWQNVKCTPDPRAAIIQSNLAQASDDRKAAATKLDEARVQRSVFDRNAVDRKVSDAATAYREAVMNSQLHSFAAMLFAKDPSEVSDAEVHEFLRLFVFLPAICAALAATLLACAAVETFKPEGPQNVVLPADFGLYALGGLTEHLVRETTEGVLNSGKTDIAAGINRGVTHAPVLVAANEADPAVLATKVA